MLHGGGTCGLQPGPPMTVEPIKDHRRHESCQRNARADHERRLPSAVVKRTGPCGRGIDGIRADAGQAQVQRGGECDAASREPLCEASNERDENRAFTDAEDEPARDHELVRTAHCGKRGTQYADRCRPESDSCRSVPVDQHAVDEGQGYIGDADDPIQHSELRLTESALPVQQIGDRADHVVLIVAGGDGDRRQREHPPAQRRIAAAAAVLGSGRVLTHR